MGERSEGMLEVGEGKEERKKGETGGKDKGGK